MLNGRDAKSSRPLVTIGIPTYNRAALLRRSIESALGQDYENIEVIVSDNASTDDTRQVVEAYQRSDARLCYHCARSNAGSTRNFSAVLERASGEFFMWLGDDDWIDQGYVGSCINELLKTPELALVSGSPHYYRRGLRVTSGRMFELQQKTWWARVVGYYLKVVDNGMFYGVMRTTQIKAVGLPHAMGNDWFTIASIASLGKTRALFQVSVHRELGGASSSPIQIAKALALPAIQGRFPVLTLAVGACWHMIRTTVPPQKRSVLSRCAVGVLVFWIVLLRHFMVYVRAWGRAMRARLANAWPA